MHAAVPKRPSPALPRVSFMYAPGAATRQQQPPRRRGEPVVPVLLRWLKERRAPDDAAVTSRVSVMLRERYAMGLAKYGQPLMSDDGRDSVVDAVQELLDALCYVAAVHMKRQAGGDAGGSDTGSDPLDGVRELHALLGELLAETPATFARSRL